jgi:hypothetical protein
LESATYSVICEHLQKPHNAGSRSQAQFFNILLKPAWGAIPTPGVPPNYRLTGTGAWCMGYYLFIISISNQLY